MPLDMLRRLVVGMGLVQVGIVVAGGHQSTWVPSWRKDAAVVEHDNAVGEYAG